MVSIKFAKPVKCSICLSNLREEIDGLLKKGYMATDIARKYHQAFNTSFPVFYHSLRNHTFRKHPPRLVPPDQQIEIDKTKIVSFEAYKDRLFKAGMSEEMFDTKKIRHSDLIAAERVSIEKQKLKTQQDALKLAMVKFMRGEAEDEEVIDGREGIIKENTE